MTNPTEIGHKESNTQNPYPNPNPLHLLIFPFPSSGHIIPLLDLTRRLLSHSPSTLTITFLITPPSLPLLQPLLDTFSPFQLQPLLLSPPPPPPSSSPLAQIRAFQVLYHPIISWFHSHPTPPHALIADFFLPWTHSLSSTLLLPRIVFHPSGAFGSSVFYSMWRSLPPNPDSNLNSIVQFNDVPGSPKFRWSELSQLVQCGKPGDPEWDLFQEEMLSNLTSWGAIFNSFSDLELTYLDHFKKEMGHDRVWAIGPLLPDEENVDHAAHRGGPSSVPLEKLLAWLDEKPKGSVVYVCFGSRTSLSMEEAKVLGEALQCSGVHFIWCVRKTDDDDGGMPNPNFEDRVAGRGFIIRGWAPQLAILRHRAVGSFLTHCGWNSVLESISAGVVMVAWPMGADQYSNAQLIVGQLGLGLQVSRDEESGVPDQVELARLLVDSTQIERGGVMSLKEAAALAVKNGSSATKLGEFIKCLEELKK